MRKIKNVLLFLIPSRFVQIIVSIKKVIKEFRRTQTANRSLAKIYNLSITELKDNRFACSWEDRMLCINDLKTELPFEPQYLYHTSWAARKIKQNNPQKHVDISSWSYFVSILSAFVDVDFYEFQKPIIQMSGLSCFQGDLVKLPFKDNSVESLSCMHTVEHVGLGRYGDPLDPKGDVKAINELKRVTKENGLI